MRLPCNSAILAAFFFLAFLLAGLAVGNPIGPRFAIYRVDLVANEAAPELERPADNPQLRNVVATQEYVGATAVRHKTPVLTEKDIAEYCWATQRVQLTPEGAERWNSLGGLSWAAATSRPMETPFSGRTSIRQ